MIFSLFLSLGVGVSSAAGSFGELQWGLNNKGNPQTIELDHKTTYRVQGRAGEDINIPPALKKTQKKIIVAVLDTGLDIKHPHLKGAIHRKESECRALEKYQKCLTEGDQNSCDQKWMNLNNPEVDQDKNGYPMDCTGWSVPGPTNAAGILGGPIMEDTQGHGTHVAGIIAARPTDDFSVQGVSANVEILPVQVLEKSPNEPAKPLSWPPQLPPADLTPGEKGKEPYRNNLGDFIARGVIYAVNSGAQVINFSMGWPESEDSVFLRATIAEAQKRGVLIVAAAGNDSTRALLRPCAYPGVICVASHGPDGSLSHFSNYGSGVTVAAPGTNVLSIYPMEKRPLRHRQSFGFEYLHGTSQATPMVSGIVAEMLAQGIPSKEIFGRLVLGARPVQQKMPLLKGAATDLKTDSNDEDGAVEKKYLLSGLADMTRAMQVSPRPLVLPFSFEKQQIQWDRRSKILTVKFPFTNYWQDVNSNQVSITGQMVRPNSQAIRPAIRSMGFSSGGAIWKTGEIRMLTVQMEITDSENPADSRIPSDLDIAAQITVGDRTQKLVLESEVIVPVTDKMQASSQTEVLPIAKMPPTRTSLISVDENLDGSLRTDYLAAGRTQSPDPAKAEGLYYLMRQNAQGTYEPSGELKVNVGKFLDQTREQVVARVNWSGQESGYALGLLTVPEDGKEKITMRFYLLDSAFKLQKSFKIDNDLVKIPLRVYWHQTGAIKAPAWIDVGLEPNKKQTLWGAYTNPDNQEEEKMRFYYLNEEGQVQSIENYEGYDFLNVLDPSQSQIKAGRVPVLLGKNQGTELKPSYMMDFAMAEVVNGKVQNFQPITSQMQPGKYRNLLDARVDQVISLRSNLESGLGTFWFGEGASKTQRLTMLLNTSEGYRFYETNIPDRLGTTGKLKLQKRSKKRTKFYDINIKALRGTVDATLKVRMAFHGNQGPGAFSFTNSEMQYTDIKSNRTIEKSLERYTFYPSIAFEDFHNPIAVSVRNQKSDLLPALMTTENVGFSHGVKIKTAVRDANNQLVEIAAPAKLRFKSEKGCKALDNPTYFRDGARAVDYHCGDRIVRMKLEY